MAERTIATPRHDERLLFLDASRGLMMLLVFLAHFGRIYFHGIDHASLPLAIQRLTMSASPTFMIVSGIMLGYLWTVRRTNFEEVKAKLIDRGLFLLTAGHAIISVAHLIFSGTFRWLFITDAIGFSMIVGPLLIGVISARARLALSGMVYAMSWIAIGAIHPTTVWQRAIMDTTVGSPAAQYYEYAFPVLPWFALYFASTALGEYIAKRRLAGDTRSLAPTFATIGLAALGGAVAVKGTYMVLSSALTIPDSSVISMLAWVFQKTPPAPAYFLFNGALGFGVLALLCVGEHRPGWRRLIAQAGLLGQSSLFLFVLQYYVYYALLSRMHLPISNAWPIYFAVSAAAILAAGIIYQRLQGNRLLTVGYAEFKHRRMLVPHLAR